MRLEPFQFAETLPRSAKHDARRAPKQASDG